MSKIEEFVNRLRDYRDVPFRHLGRSMEGVDCIGLIVCSLKDVGIEVVDNTTYRRIPNPKLLLDTVNLNNVVKIENIKEIKVGDILLMKFDKEPQHFSVVVSLNPTYIIHCYYQVKKVVEHRLDSTWINRIVSIYRIKDIQ